MLNQPQPEDAISTIKDEHVREVIARLNAEAKAHRESAEKAIKEFQDLKAAYDAEKAAAKKKADDEAAKGEAERVKKLSDDEKKAEADAERIKRAELLEKRLADMEKAHKDEREADRFALIRTALEAEAEKAGIIDVDLIDLWKVEGVEVKKGKVTGVKELVEKIKADKPHLFAKKETTRTEHGRFTPPAPNLKDFNGQDSRKLDKSKFEELEARLRGRRI